MHDRPHTLAPAVQAVTSECPNPFPWPSNNISFEAALHRQCGEEARVAFTYRQTSRERGLCGVEGCTLCVKEGHGVVGDVVVQPGEERAGFICVAGEWGGEVVG